MSTNIDDADDDDSDVDDDGDNNDDDDDDGDDDDDDEDDEYDVDDGDYYEVEPGCTDYKSGLMFIQSAELPGIRVFLLLMKQLVISPAQNPTETVFCCFD
ncbi:hypothetical protein ElyMa_005667000 [Elysia marginata]|uniref:Uncharacterized protein n=1 Tax=Elysia marginata TaxID=1093978 RepID=A0AAV4FF45_9GAST|nr:hypothetical protein ElyMa_005667000 [Elysia marginata]